MMLNCSIIIPWGGSQPELLEKQVDALYAQRTSRKFEVIISMNSEEAYSYASYFQTKYPHLEITNSSMIRGASFARNQGAKLARSSQLLFCDADDVVSQNWVDEMSKALDSADFVGSKLRYSKLNGPNYLRQDRKSNKGLSRPENFLESVPGGASGFQSEVFWKLEGFDLDSQYVEDIDISWRAQLSGYLPVFVGTSFIDYRLDRGFLTCFKKHFAYGKSYVKLIRKYTHLGLRFSMISVAFSFFKAFVALLVFLPNPRTRSNAGYILGFFCGRLLGLISSRRPS